MAKYQMIACSSDEYDSKTTTMTDVMSCEFDCFTTDESDSIDQLRLAAVSTIMENLWGSEDYTEDCSVMADGVRKAMGLDIGNVVSGFFSDGDWIKIEEV